MGTTEISSDFLRLRPFLNGDFTLRKEFAPSGSNFSLYGTIGIYCMFGGKIHTHYYFKLVTRSDGSDHIK